MIKMKTHTMTHTQKHTHAQIRNTTHRHTHTKKKEQIITHYKRNKDCRNLRKNAKENRKTK